MIGTLVDEYAFAVEEGKVMEFARAIKDPAARYVDAEAARDEGFAAIPAPLTFTVIAGHHRDAAAAVALLGLDIRRVVVGEVGWEYERPPVVGDVLHGRRTVADVQRKDGARGGTMTFVTLATEFRDAAEEVVVRQREVLIETAKASS
ncbi:MAG TPA: MaoC family dehydratase N-terminal domain-containing protein [Baekduia sp.]|uniref:FAS1-like dehydratase domain-containing protein n=1 Tax=Baekduia sp. TaxID=2600305 RepID=UPI002D76FAB0|nr:MaoC family dehydratase N-terminal domain-containing protein [Baekduia sp.]HET6507912.1 MaoC family dehydratase N-terminal domain-containing protein [Baekduia sp.]